MTTYPGTFSHTGISVPDVEKAVGFYNRVMGGYQIMEPTAITEESDTPIGLPLNPVWFVMQEQLPHRAMPVQCY